MFFTTLTRVTAVTFAVYGFLLSYKRFTSFNKKINVKTKSTLEGGHRGMPYVFTIIDTNNEEYVMQSSGNNQFSLILPGDQTILDAYNKVKEGGMHQISGFGSIKLQVPKIISID